MKTLLLLLISIQAQAYSGHYKTEKFLKTDFDCGGHTYITGSEVLESTKEDYNTQNPTNKQINDTLDKWLAECEKF
jgi:hypothetical protein